ncbi:BMP family ABC transporter substrate-binding protein [Acidaminobacter sp. JC074]|uniref:BMP family ABC transporter substrate-binding protein n=1 Tax=Acidaminobacter sp. JC074 TaxID=2530199 RepID=UPI001F1192A2|nr:BMP family ABC transporter substrate-binding protein [Acidaminobacter sp. JC074]
MKKISILLIMIMCFTLISCDSGITTSLTKEEHVTQAMMNTFSSGSVDMTADMEMGIGFETLMDTLSRGEFGSAETTLLSNLGFNINYKIKSDLDQGAFDYKINYLIDYKDKALMDTNLFFNLKRFGFSVDNFYDGTFVFDFDKIIELLLEQENMEVLAEIDYSKYFNIILSEMKAYEVNGQDAEMSILYDHFRETLSEGVQDEMTFVKEGKEVTEDVLVYDYKFDIAKIMNLYVAYFESAQNDESVKEFYKDLINKLLDEAIESGDYELVEIDLLELEALRQTVNQDFDTYWDEFFDSFLSEFNTLQDDVSYQELQEVYDYFHVKIYIGHNDVLKCVTLDMDHPEVELNAKYTINAIGDDVEITYDEDKFIHVLDYIDFETPMIVNEEEAEKILKDAAFSAIDELQNGQGFSALFKDLGQFENEYGLGVMGLNVALNQAKSSLEQMNIVEMINENLSYMGYDDSYEETYEEEVLPELEKIVFLTIDDSETADIIRGAAEGQGIDFDVYKLENEDNQAVLEKLYVDGVNMVFIEDRRLKEAAMAIGELYEDFKIVALFSEGEDYFPFNMAALEVYDEEPAFAAGYVAALSSETGKIGFVYGQDDYKTRNIAYGFRSGAAYADESVEVVSFMADSDDNESIAKDIAEQAQNDGVDILYHDAGNIGNTLVDLSGDYDYMMISNSEYGINNENTLMTHFFDLNVVVNNIIENYNYGYFEPYYYVSLGSNEMVFSRSQLSDDVHEKLLLLIEDVTYGSLYIEPYYED